MANQLRFDWDASEPLKGGELITQSRTSRIIPIQKITLRDKVKTYLSESQITYVDVNQAKRQLFASTKLGTFHFVAYDRFGKNWLIWAAQVRKGVRKDMVEWEKVFGAGFVAVIAKSKFTGEVVFRKLNGEIVEIT